MNSSSAILLKSFLKSASLATGRRSKDYCGVLRSRLSTQRLTLALRAGLNARVNIGSEHGGMVSLGNVEVRGPCGRD